MPIVNTETGEIIDLAQLQRLQVLAKSNRYTRKTKRRKGAWGGWWEKLAAELVPIVIALILAWSVITFATR